MGVFQCITLPSEQFDGKHMAIPVANIQQLSCNGNSDKVWLIYWAEGHTARRPIQGTWDENCAALDAAHAVRST